MWKEFGSSHSAHVTIIGTFADVKKAELVKDAITDLWDNFDPHAYECVDAKNPSQAFKDKWGEQLCTYGITNDDMQVGSSTTTDIKVQDGVLTIQPGDTSNVFAFIKLLMQNEATEIKMTGPFSA